MGISIKNLLLQEYFKDFQVLAGSSGLHREVQGVAVMDAPDSFRWSKGKELVLSSGYVLSQEPDCLQKAFAEGSIQKTSALMLKRGRYVNQIPEELLALFDRHEIPLISMPFEIPYMDVMKQINTIVMNRTVRRFQIQQTGALQLTNTSYKDQKIRKILQAVEVEMNFPAFLYDVGEDAGYYSSVNFSRISQVYGLEDRDYWDPRPEHSQNILCDYTKMSRIRLAGSDHPDSPRVSWVLMPIVIGGVTQAYFVVMESKDLLDYYDEYAIRIAYLLLQDVYEQLVIARNLGNIGFENFVLFAMNVSDEDRERLLYQAGQQGLSLDTQYTCLLFCRSDGAARPGSDRKLYVRAFEGSGISKNAKLAFLNEYEGVILLESQDENPAEPEALHKLMGEFREKVQEACPGTGLQFAFLREGKRLSSLRQSLEKCRRVLKMGRKLCPEQSVWDDEMIGPLLWLQIPEDELELMLREYRQLLRDEKNAELLRTLKVYLENNMNYSVTAEKLYAHINTIRKRIDKVDSLLHIDWSQHMSRLKAEILLQFLEL